MSTSSINPAPLAPGAGRSGPVSAPVVSATGFGDVLSLQRGLGASVVFSSHASQRVSRRGIDVSPAVLQRLGGGVDRAAAKGSRETVVFVDGTAFVVGVDGRTVITAVDKQNMRDFVFTNIDSAVIA